MYYENVRREKGKEQYNNKQHRLFFSTNDRNDTWEHGLHLLGVGCGCAGQCLGMKLQQVNFRGKKGKKKGGGLEIIVRDYSQSWKKVLKVSFALF